MNDTERRWILAFDASCATCRQIADATTEAVGDKLEVTPFSDPDVRKWRERALSLDAVPVPTLLEIQGDNVRAWTGMRMGIQLVRRLGLRHTALVLQALGQLQRQAKGRPLEPSSGNVIGRGGFLRMGAGAAIAAGLVLAGRTPAFAEQGCAAATAWVEANRSRLPQTYDEIARYPMVYRRAIYTNLAPTSKSRFWVTQLSRYRTTHPGLSSDKVAHIDELILFAGRPSAFTTKPDEAVNHLSDRTIQLFGDKEAGLLVASLGPAAPTARASALEPQTIACECADGSDYCNTGFWCRYREQNCQFQDGCGFLGFYVCNGLCVSA